ncbi:adhesion G protein-coupled receptor A3-like isoform X2 [Scyliorhinus canicula]|uniref:adhesion G protein-coupled receptor A3-like isoform X2 n=1 Tax=Scyliorhinus canicula TaxID=7830 RepID=UPI0018F77D44|nr:adhesion G protein-coupled receptor A3-like isoform X2 [Scyliorhinus canicula]
MKLLYLVHFMAGLLGNTAGNRNCPDLIIDSCSCASERSKGPSRQIIRIKVACSHGELLETLQSSLLPNQTVTLILSNNKISLLKNGSFFGLRSLERLDLKNNLISNIEPRALYGLPELKRLDLSNNRIGCLSPEIFTGLTSLSKLNLSGNIFSTLPLGLFVELGALKVLHFGTESLMCDCNLRWLLQWAKNSSVRIADETLCVYPSALQGQPFKTLKQNQLSCDGPLELPLFQMIPSRHQVVFRGDRLPFLCTATYVDKSTQIQWLHGGNVMVTDEDNEILVEPVIIHDCCLISSELILSNIDVDATGEWECLITTSRGNSSKKVELMVLETAAPYCPAERVTNNKGDFRWPRTLAGITAYYTCARYPFGSVPYYGDHRQRKAWRKCDRSGRWEEGNYTECAYANEVTRVLHAFSQIPVNATNALAFAHQLMTYTGAAANFADMMDVIFVARMIQKLIIFVDRVKDLGESITEIASNMMLVDEHILWMAQNEEKACTRMVQCVEFIASLVLTSNTQGISKVSMNIALEAFMIKPASFTGMTCTAFQKMGLHPGRSLTRDVARLDWEAEYRRGQHLNFKCNTGNLASSLVNFPAKNTVAVASVQLPPAIFTHFLALHTVDNSSCKLQFIVFRNGKLFPSTGNSSNLADDGKRKCVSTPVVFVKIDGCSFGNLTKHITVVLRHFALGADPTAAYWDFDLLDGHGGWHAKGCHITGSASNITTIQCMHFGNIAVLMDLKTVLSFNQYPGEFLHPVVYACTAVLLLCLFASIITYIVHHSTIRISRKGWHMLLNFCFHTALTCAVFAGGINRTKYPIICQAVGIVLHYSTLSTIFWICVTARNIYKQVTRKVPQYHDADQPPQSQQPMLRFYLIGGGIPFIICGITAATNINNYGSEDNAPYCWMAWEPSLGAFYGPAAFIVLVSCVYFLCTLVQLKRHPGKKYELKEMTEEQQRLASTEVGPSHVTDSSSASHTCSMISSSMLENEHSFKAQLRASVFTLFLFIAMWTFGALAVSQGHFLDMIFSCLYGAVSVTLGLFILVHHCAKRDDVWHCWWSCCKSNRNTYAVQMNVRPQVTMNGDAQLHVPCLLDSPCPSKSSSSCNHSVSGLCKLTNLQAVQNHVNCLSPVTPCCAKMHNEQIIDDDGDIHLRADGACRPAMHIHRCQKSRTKPRHFIRHSRSAAQREYAYHIPSSIDGSVHSSHTESHHSIQDSQSIQRQVVCAKSDQCPNVCQPESSDTSTMLYGCNKAVDSAVSTEALHQGVTFEMQSRRQSCPLSVTNQNGILKGNLHEAMIYTSDSTGNIRTGPWKNETTV